MNNAQNSIDFAEGNALLTHLPSLYYAIAQSARLESTEGSRVQCSIEIPALGWRSCDAPTAREAIRNAFTVLLNECTAMPVHEWPSSWHKVTAEADGGRFHPIDGKSKTQTERFKSKGRQFTIGATMPTKLKDALQTKADQQNTTFADVARQIASLGFDEFDIRSFSEDPEELFVELSSEIRNWLPSATEQVMLRMEPNLNVRIRSAAQEVHKSASEFGTMCIAAGFAKQAEFVLIQERIENVRGVKTRELAMRVGLGNYSPLLASILTGSVRAPRKVLASLGEVFATTEGTLSHFFKLSFAARAVPAFKAAGKPQLSQRATTWKEAVKLLTLSQSETNELLALDAKTQ